jgi:hypothetical protein
MPFLKGRVKTGGRQKGTKNKMRSVEEELILEDFSIGKRLSQLFNKTDNEMIQVRLLELAAKFVHPVPAPVRKPAEPVPVAQLSDDELLASLEADDDDANNPEAPASN